MVGLRSKVTSFDQRSSLAFELFKLRKNRQNLKVMWSQDGERKQE